MASSLGGAVVLGREEVHRLLGMETCIRLLREGFEGLGSGKVQLPLRNVMWLQPDQKNAFALMPCSISVKKDPLDDDESDEGEPRGSEDERVYYGAKVLSVFFTNIGTKHDSHLGVLLLFEGKHGHLRAIIDAGAVTQIRTAAASGLATQLVGPSWEGLKLALLGAGVQADSHLEAMLVARPNIRRVSVWNRTTSKAHEFVSRMKPKLPSWSNAPIELEVSETVQEAVKDADVVCTLTASTTPILEWSWLKKGCHINAVGASNARTRELDSETMLHSWVCTDRRESLLNEGGDFLIPLSEGRYDSAHLKAELSDLVAQQVPSPRTSSGEQVNTVFKSLGLALEDLVCAVHLYRLAKAEKRLQSPSSSSSSSSSSPLNLLWINLE